MGGMRAFAEGKIMLGLLLVLIVMVFLFLIITEIL